uniref:Uncharacterized protein n=1 Tax=Moniliophthora roreri TaxID=221103 RepID=A0A0W0FEH7_MONRR
MITEFHLT